MENLEPSASKQIKKQETESPEPEAVFAAGQPVNVMRSNLQIQTGWQVKDVGLDGVIHVYNPAKKLSKIVNQKELQDWQELGLYTGQAVCMQNPETQQIEYGWQVNEFAKDDVQIINKKAKKQALVPIEDLKTWNDQQTLLPGHQVFLKTKEGIPEPGWQIQTIDKETGEIQIFNATQNKTKTVLPEELAKNLQPTERYTRKREMKK